MSKAVVQGNLVRTGFMEGLPAIDPLLKQGLSRHVSGKVKTELQEIREMAAAEGHSEGFSEGYASGQAEGFESGLVKGRRESRADFDAQHAVMIESASDHLASIVEDAQAAFDAWRVEQESQLADLAITIVRRALSSELHISRESVMEITRNALHAIVGSGKVQIRVNPIDSGLLDAQIRELQDAAGRHRVLEVVSDPTVESGCRLMLDGGLVDATIDGYIDRIEESLEDAA